MIIRQVRIDSISVIYFDLFSLSLGYFISGLPILSSRTLDACQLVQIAKYIIISRVSC